MRSGRALSSLNLLGLVSRRCYGVVMEKAVDGYRGAGFEQEFEREIAADDDTAARDILASGTAIHIAREDTPAGHVVRIAPDGREELIRIDRDEAASILGG